MKDQLKTETTGKFSNSPSAQAWLKISIVTPSYNQGQYIEETIQSVLLQNHPNIEYLIMDGGSTDNSCDVIKQYDQQLTYWQSEKDNGQSDAINQGFAKSTGDILCWLNSDDMYMPAALKKIQNVFSGLNKEEPTIVFGNCIHMLEETRQAYGSDVRKMHDLLDLTLCDYIIQPACFWNRAAWECVGSLSETLDFGFDWEWFIRAVEAGVTFIPIDDVLAVYRMHAQHKSGTGGDVRLQELAKIYKTYHSEPLADSFLKLKTSKMIQRAYTFIDRARLDKIMSADRIVHKIFFPGITWKEFKNIIRM